MSRQRRYVSVALGLVTLLALGFVVAVAARSRPGGVGDDPMFEIDTRFDIDLGRFFGWTLVVLAVLGAVILVFAIKEVRPRRRERKRSYAGVILGVLAFILILRFLQPVAENFIGDSGSAGSAEAGGEPGPAGGGSAAWLFSLLVAAVVAAALTRVGLAVRQSDTSFDEPASDAGVSGRAPASKARSAVIELGVDARSRILNAYSRFEETAAGRGVIRRMTETASRHARRVATELDLDGGSVGELMSRYSRTRFGFGPASDSDAEMAESLALSLCQEMER
ncbi:MAG: DUF4129 domain-containing protein [Acidimicrobiia bacterium]